MKKVIIVLMSVIAILSFTACEKNATASDFLSNDDIEGILGEDFIVDPEIGVLDPPQPIIEINGTLFFASQQIAFLTQNGLSIIFVNEQGNEIKLSIASPASQTYTAQSTSTNLFVAEYTIGDGDLIFTTLPAQAPNSDGALGLVIDGNTVRSEFFRFNAFVSGTTNEAQGINGDFEDVMIIDQR